MNPLIRTRGLHILQTQDLSNSPDACGVSNQGSCNAEACDVYFKFRLLQVGYTIS